MEKQTPTVLERKLGLFSVTNIVIANMIGVGIFTTSGMLMGSLENPVLMIVLWGIGGGIALSGSLCYGELGAAMPNAGGEYIFLSRLYSPQIGFLSGWVSFVVGFSAPIAASSIGFSEYLSRALPILFQSGPLGFEWMKKVYSVFIILIFTLIHLRGVKFGSIVQNWLTLLKIGLICTLILTGFLFGNGNLNNFNVPESYDFSFNGWKSIGLSLMWIMFAYSGWNASTYIGSEIKEPGRNLPKSLILGSSAVLILYLLLNVLFVYAIGPEQMEGVISVGGLAVHNLFGPSFDKIFSLLIALALFSSISAYIILGPRVYFAMAEDGHFFRFTAKIHSKSKVPYLSIIFQAFISVIIILTGTFDQIMTYMGFALSIFPILTVIGVFKLRKQGRSVFKLPGYPITAIIFIAASVAILTLSFVERPKESMVAMITILIGFPAYYLFKRKAGADR